MIDSGSLTERIKFLEPETSKGKYGSRVIDNWNPVYVCWANVKYNKGTRAISAGEVWLPNTIAILVRYTSKINERQRILWDSKIYRIDSFNSSKKTGSTTIVATRVDEGTESE